MPHSAQAPSLSLDMRKRVLSRLRLSPKETNTSTPSCAIRLLNVRALENLSDSHVPGDGDGKGHGTCPKEEGART